MKRLLCGCLLAAFVVTPIASWSADDTPAILSDLQARAHVVSLDLGSMSEIRGMANPMFLALLSRLSCEQLRMVFTWLITNAQPCPECPECSDSLWSGQWPPCTTCVFVGTTGCGTIQFMNGVWFWSP